MFGLLLTTSGTNGTGNALWYMPYTNSSNAGGASVSVRYGANWTMATDYGSVQYAGDWSGWLHQRIVAKGSDQWQFFVSHDGVSWLDLWGGVKTIAGFAPTHMGIGYSTWGATWTGTASAEFIRLYDSDLGDSPAGYFDVL